MGGKRSVSRTHTGSQTNLGKTPRRFLRAKVWPLSDTTSLRQLCVRPLVAEPNRWLELSRLKASLPYNELAPSQTSVYEQPSAARAFNEPLSYSITVSCLGQLIRHGHQVSHHFHWEDQQSFAIPVRTSQSPVWAACCPQAHLHLVRPNSRDSDAYWQTHKPN